jgi:hypothetical protein
VPTLVEGLICTDARERPGRASVAKPDDWIDQSVIVGTDIYEDDIEGTLEEVSDRGVVVRHELVELETETELVELETELENEVVELETELASEATLQSIFYPWTKINWMYHPE